MWKKTFLCLTLVVSVSTVQSGLTEAERANAPAGTAERTAASKLVAGQYFTCVLGSTGKIRCWGDNTYGQLGNGSTNSVGETSSVEVSGITNAVEVTAGAYHACALLADTTIKCWGYGTYGQLGNGRSGDGSNETTPATVKDASGTGVLSGVRSVAAGYDHTCAVIDADGSVYCWGAQTSGQLGNGAPLAWTWQTTPVRVKTDASTFLVGVADIVSGTGNSCALKSNGTALCWGSNGNGQLGTGDFTSSSYAVPFGATPVTGLTAMSIGSGTICGTTTTALVCAGGSNNQYVFGYQMRQSTPQSRPESGIKQVAVSDGQTCMILSAGTVSCAGGLTHWVGGVPTTLGVNGTGTGPSSSFTTVAGLTGVSALAAGADFFCASGTGGLKCWGANGYGQLGTGVISPSAGVSNVLGALPTIVTFADPGAKTVDSAAFDLSATADSGEAVTFAVDSQSATTCSVSGARLAILGAGSCAITANAAASGLYAAGNSSRTIAISALAPTAVTGDASDITMSGATLAATVNAKGASTTTKVEYSIDAALVGAKSVDVTGTQTGIAASSISAALSGLTPGLTYFYRFTATNAIGSAQGVIKSFTAKGAKPVVSTGSVTPSATKATLNGKVNPSDLDTTITFEYGTDAKLVTSTATPAQTKSGADDVDLSATITGLDEKTTYYYRIVATNVVGTAKGDIKSFVTTKPEGVSINDGDEFTGSQQVTISIVGPSNAAKAILSNDGGFKTSETVALTNGVADVPWTLQSSREGTFTKIVYIRLISRFESTLRDLSDDIILDTTKPAMSTTTAAAATPANDAVQVAAVRAAAKGGIKLSVRGSDTISGIGSVEVRSSASKPSSVFKLATVAGKADGKARAMNQTISLKSTAMRLQVRVVDRAGNASAWRSIIVK